MIEKARAWLSKATGGSAGTTVPPAPAATTQGIRAIQRAQAGYAVRLALTFQRWVHRRVETFEFVDAKTVRRRTSVDCAPPIAGGIQAGEAIYVPLMIPIKDNLRNLDVRDENGRVVPVSTTSENAKLAVEGLAEILESFWPAGAERPRAVLGRIIAEEDPVAAITSADTELADGRPLADALAAYPNANEAENIRALVRELAKGFLLLVPIEHQPGERRVLKFSYDAARELPWQRSSWQSDGDKKGQATAWFLRLLSSFGLMPRVEDLEDLPAGWTESYHAEAIPPPDTFVEDARMNLVYKDERLLAATDDHDFRPHLMVHARQRGDRAEVTLMLQAQREVLVLPLLLASVAIAAVLAFVPDNASRLDSQALGALLLLPLALVAYYARSSESSYLRSMMRGVRFVAGVPVLCGLGVLALVALEKLGPGACPADLATFSSWAERGAQLSIAASMLLFVAFLSPLVKPGAPERVRRGQLQPTESKTSLLRSPFFGVAGMLLVAGAVTALVYYLLGFWQP